MLNGTFLCLKVIYAGFYNKFKTFAESAKKGIHFRSTLMKKLTDV